MLRVPNAWDDYRGLDLSEAYRDEMAASPCPGCGGPLRRGSEHETLMSFGCGRCQTIYRITSAGVEKSTPRTRGAGVELTKHSEGRT